jgi:hypothetical protein
MIIIEKHFTFEGFYKQLKIAYKALKFDLNRYKANLLVAINSDKVY